MRWTVVTVLLLVAGAPAATVEVTPDRVDALRAARDGARKVRAQGSPVTIVLRGGTYVLRESLELGPQDSGATWQAAAGAPRKLSGDAPSGTSPSTVRSA